jgi:hypothetical protein
VSFKAGDMAVVIAVPGAIYPNDALPGTIVTIVSACSCIFTLLTGTPYWVIDAPSKRRLCAAEPTLRKIDGESRQLVRWDTVPWQPQREEMPA